MSTTATLDAPAVTAAPQPYGPWATAGWGVLIWLAWNIVVPLPVVLLAGDRLQDTAADFGFWVSCAALVTQALVPALVVMAIRQRAGGAWAVSDYLQLQAPRRAWHWAVGLGATVVLMQVGDVIVRGLGHPTTSPVMDRAFDTSPLWLFLLTTVLGAPLLEEVVFRGFLYKGWAASRLRPLGAVLLTSAIFAAMHGQYDAVELTAVFAFALLLGAVRWWSGSLWLCIAMHALNNAMALAQTAWWR